MKKPFLFVALAALASAAALSGCGQQKGGDMVDDLERDENGNFVVEYLDGVQVNLRSVIGNPDKPVLDKLINEFNREYAGMIEVKVTAVAHESYYNALETDFIHNWKNFPDLCLMHNEKNIEYASQNYFYAVDDIIDDLGLNLDFDNVYDNIEKTTLMDGKHYGIPVDAHGYLCQIRQDIIKKNELGFDGNTRFVPNNYEEYQSLLESLREKADAGELYLRDIRKVAPSKEEQKKGQHAWYKITHRPETMTSEEEEKNLAYIEDFYPSFVHYEESDHLSALYVNGGSLVDNAGRINFQNNDGFKRYVKDYVNRFNSGLTGDIGSKEEAFSTGKTIFFSEGPWQVANTYDAMWNNSELKVADEALGVSEEDANDPVYQHPYVVSRHNWLANPEGNVADPNKWYGNGHVFALTKKVTSLKKAAACLFFVEWLTQQQSEEGEYHLSSWCSAGHIPAWSNVYNSDSYRNVAAKSMTLQAMGNPENVIALESLRYATTIVGGLKKAVGDVENSLESTAGCTEEEALQKLSDVARSTQRAIDRLG